MRKVVDSLSSKYRVPTEHLEHANPAAQGDIFCDGHHLQVLYCTVLCCAVLCCSVLCAHEPMPDQATSVS